MRENVTRWVRRGPDSTDGTIGFIVGHWLYWRIWLLMVLVLAAFALMVYLEGVLSGVYLVWATFFLGYFMYPLLQKVYDEGESDDSEDEEE